jgi:hypothetical protein
LIPARKEQFSYLLKVLSIPASTEEISYLFEVLWLILQEQNGFLNSSFACTNIM